MGVYMGFYIGYIGDITILRDNIGEIGGISIWKRKGVTIGEISDILAKSGLFCIWRGRLSANMVEISEFVNLNAMFWGYTFMCNRMMLTRDVGIYEGAIPV